MKLGDIFTKLLHDTGDTVLSINIEELVDFEVTAKEPLYFFHYGIVYLMAMCAAGAVAPDYETARAIILASSPLFPLILVSCYFWMKVRR